MNVRATIILGCAVGLGIGAAATGCEAGFIAGQGSGGGATTVSGGTSVASSSSGTLKACSPGNPGVCGDAGYCLMNNGCAATVGVCTSFTSGPLDETPLCGCDGVTYWNAAVAIAANQQIRLEAACGPAGHECTGAGTCAGGAKCDLDWTKTGCATPTPQGYCWMLPDTCPDVTKLTGGVACGSAANTACKSDCSLIMDEMPWKSEADCP